MGVLDWIRARLGLGGSAEPDDEESETVDAGTPAEVPPSVDAPPAKAAPPPASGAPKKSRPKRKRKKKKKKRKHRSEPVAAAPAPAAPRSEVMSVEEAERRFGHLVRDDAPPVPDPEPPPAVEANPEPEPEPEPEPTADAAPGESYKSWALQPKVDALHDEIRAVVDRDDAERDWLITTRKRLGRDRAALGRLDNDQHRRLEEALGALDARIGAMEDPRLAEERANLASKEALIASAEALADASDLREAMGKLKSLREAWRAVGHVPRDRHKELAARWKAAGDALYARRDEEQAERLSRLESLVERAERLVGSSDPGAAAETVKGLQARWKAVGSVGRNAAADALWTRFRAAADAVFAERNAARDAERAENLSRKEALVAQALSLAAQGVDDPDPHIDSLMKAWKRIGHVPRAQSDAVWARFKDACDALRAPPTYSEEALGDGADFGYNPFAALASLEE